MPCRRAHARYGKLYQLDRLRGVPRRVPVAETSRLARALVEEYGWTRTKAITRSSPAQIARLIRAEHPTVNATVAARFAEAAAFYLAEPVPRRGLVDEVAVGRAIAGDAKVRLTAAERREAARLLRGKVPDREAARVTGVSRRQVVRYHNYPSPADRAARIEAELLAARRDAERAAS